MEIYHLDKKAIILLSTAIVAIGSVSWYVLKWQQEDNAGNSVQGLSSGFTIGPTVVRNIVSERSTTAIPTATPSFSPGESREFPALFLGLQWQPITKTQVTFRTKAGALVTREGEHAQAKPVANCPADFLAYYERQLLSAGWHQTWAAGGDCGSFLSGDQFGYEQSGGHFQFGVIVTHGEYIAYVEHD